MSDSVIGTQWALLSLLGLLVVLTYRQLAYLLKLDDATDAHRAGLDLGERVESFEYQALDHQPGSERKRFQPGSPISLILLTDPGCGSCDTAIRALGELVKIGSPPSHALVLMRGGPGIPSSAIEAADAGVRIGAIESSVAARIFRSRVTPFFFVLDREGRVRGKGAIETTTEMQELVRKAAVNEVGRRELIPTGGRVS